MQLTIARFTNLMLASLLTGNEIGTFVVVHPALHRLPTRAHVQAEQAITRRYGALMPILMTSTLLSCAPVAGLSRRRGSTPFRLTLGGMACYAAMLGVTLTGNVPINRRTLEVTPEIPADEWLELRRRWERLHLMRVLLDSAGWTCLCLAALSDSE